MQQYETVFIIKPELTEESIEGIINRVKELIDKSGQIESVDEWGKRRLAYTVKKKYNEGYYVLINFSAESNFLETLEHNFRVSEDIIRHVIIKKED